MYGGGKNKLPIHLFIYHIRKLILFLTGTQKDLPSLYRSSNMQLKRLQCRKTGTPHGVVGAKASFLAVGAWGLEGLHWPAGFD